MISRRKVTGLYLATELARIGAFAHCLWAKSSIQTGRRIAKCGCLHATCKKLRTLPGLVTREGPLFRGGRSRRRFRAGSFDSVVKAFAGRSYSAWKTWPASDKCLNLFRTVVL